MFNLKLLSWNKVAFGMGLIALVTVFAFPIFALLGYSISAALDNWQNWIKLFSVYVPIHMKNTVLLCLGGGILALMWGVSCAWIVTNFDFPARKYINWILILPMSCPVYISGFVYSDMFSNSIRGFHGIPTAALLFGAGLYPYVYIFARNAFREQSMDYLWAAQTLGLRGWRSFGRVSLPMALPFISFGFLLVIMEIINDFGLVNHYAINTMSLGIYKVWFGLGSVEGAAILSLFTISMIALIMIAEAYALSKRKRYKNQTSHSPLEVRKLPQLQALLCFGWCILPIIIGFFMPVISLSYYSINTNVQHPDWLYFYDPLINSIKLALLVILACLAASLAINYCARGLAPIYKTLGQSISICYALPGTLLGFTCILLFSTLSAFLPGTIMLGSIFLLVFGCALRFSPIANRNIHNELIRITPSMEMSAKLFESQSRQVFTRVHLPLLKGAILSSCLIIFVDLMKELPLTLILRPFNFETLATFTYQYASDERMGTASLPALLIIATSMPIIYLLNRTFSKARRENLI